MTEIFSGIRSSTLKASARVGGFFGWYFTVMYICERSLHYYRDDSLLTSVNITFMVSALITAIIFAVVLMMFDFEGALNDKLLRWLPGLIMAESGIALSLATADTMTVLAAVAGIAFGLGGLAILTSLLRVKVGQRLLAIGIGLMIGGAVRLLSTLVISYSSQTGLIIMSVIIGIFAALTVHSNGYTKLGGPLISLAEAPPKKIITGIPPVFIALFFSSAAYYFIYSKINSVMSTKLLADIISDDYTGYFALTVAAVMIGLLCHFRSTPSLFAAGTTITLAACALATLSNITETEACFFSLFFMGAHAFIRISLLTAIIVFSLDKPHPLFYSMFGFTVLVGGELLGSYLSVKFECDVSLCMVLALALLLVGTTTLSSAMKRGGFTSEQLAHRSMMRTQLKTAAADLELSERESAILQFIVIDGHDIDEIADKLLVSRNTAKAQTRMLFSKLGVKNADEAREHFSTLTSAAEAEQAEETERLEKERIEMVRLRQELREAELQLREEELVRKAAEKAAAKEESDIIVISEQDDDKSEDPVNEDSADSEGASEEA